MKILTLLCLISSFSIFAKEKIWSSTQLNFNDNLSNHLPANIESFVSSTQWWTMADYYDDIEARYAYDFYQNIIIKYEKDNLVITCKVKESCGKDKLDLSETTCAMTKEDVQTALKNKKIKCEFTQKLF